MFLRFQIVGLIIFPLLMSLNEIIRLPTYMAVFLPIGVMGFVLWMIIDTRGRGQVFVVDMR